MRLAGSDELERWDDLVAANPDGGQILQTRTWGQFKATQGWRPTHVIYDDIPGLTAPLAVLWLHRGFPGFGELWYTPKGPGVANAEQLQAVAERTDLFGRAFLARLEPELPEGTPITAPLRKAPFDIQISRATIIVDLRPGEEALLAGFHHKTRYNIRLAGRKGVTVVDRGADAASLDLMFRLMQATQERAGFPLRRRDYFERYWRMQCAAGQGRLFFAEHEGEVLAGAFITIFGTKAWYKDGGSFKEQSSVMAPHLLQWEVMRWLRARGVTDYDLVAVPRQSEMSESHPMYGLYRFKSGFNPSITEFVGTYDLPLRARRYQAWNRAGELLANAWAQRVRGNLLY